MSSTYPRGGDKMKLLDGRKTYLGIAIGVIYSIAIYFGIVPNNQIIWTLILGWTGVAFRLAVEP